MGPVAILHYADNTVRQPVIQPAPPSLYKLQVRSLKTHRNGLWSEGEVLTIICISLYFI